MSDLSAYFLSDLHLVNREERNSQTLLRFLRSLSFDNNGGSSRNCSHLIFLGDIFDLWIGGHKVFQNHWMDLIQEVRRLQSEGVEIYYWEGNHDLHLHCFWRDALKVNVFTEAKYLKLGLWWVRLEHGDLINLEDKAYLRFRKFVRSGPLALSASLIPGVFWQWLGTKLAEISRKKSRAWREGHVNEMKKMIHFHAHRSYKEQAFDYIIAGHMHVQDVYQFTENSKEVYSINLGWWKELAKVYHLGSDGGKFIELA